MSITKRLKKKILRCTYRWKIFYVVDRGEIPHILNSLELVNEGAEIGVQRGRYSKIILQKWKGKKLYSIDPWTEFGGDYIDIANVTQAEHNRRYLDATNNLKPFSTRSEIIKATSEEAAKRFSVEQLDFAYIDAMHDYESIKGDIDLWWPKIRKGGLLAGHDYFDGIRPNGAFGVKTAVDEFVSKKRLKLLTTNDKSWKSWLMFKSHQ